MGLLLALALLFPSKEASTDKKKKKKTKQSTPWINALKEEGNRINHINPKLCLQIQTPLSP